MKHPLFILFVVGLVLCLSTVSTTAQAQNTPGDAPVSDITIDTVPENPGPNKLVSATVVSYSTDLNMATITWKVNGKTQKTGIGQKTFTFATGSINSETTLEVKIETAEGQTVLKTLNIRPVGVDLLWQSYGFVPPFYKGRTLFGHQNNITFIAIPHIAGRNGREIPAENLVYKWIRNGSVMEENSGYGRSVFTMTGSVISRPLQIDVEVTSADSDGVGYVSTSVTPTEPSVLLYRKSPLYGIEFQRALTNTIELKGSKEIIVTAMPFFFGTARATNPSLIYKWSINGIASDDTNQTTKVFRQANGASGISNISLSIENSNKILQYASEQFNVTFRENGSQ